MRGGFSQCLSELAYSPVCSRLTEYHEIPDISTQCPEKGILSGFHEDEKIPPRCPIRARLSDSSGHKTSESFVDASIEARGDDAT
jgi:hypothetical protein